MACEFCAPFEAPRHPSDALDQSALMSLVAAVERGAFEEAALCLDVIFRDDFKAREWIAQARVFARRRAA